MSQATDQPETGQVTVGGSSCHESSLTAPGDLSPVFTDISHEVVDKNFQKTTADHATCKTESLKYSEIKTEKRNWLHAAPTG